ncbi:hypothetical protein CPB83DRAFT_910377 [Crepidotus variabilis]|uniref:Uncharacterized protein n=1 Tax=Crepidotus variabilis TaxID=179855 RepID=A0A9P6E7F3_9AGAR|nr:hypothetical protein CPB83DRAFT_910377 [Crepidotus variabilis]
MIIIDEDQSQMSPISERSPLTVLTKGSAAARSPTSTIPPPPPYAGHAPNYQAASHSHHHHQHQHQQHGHHGLSRHTHHPQVHHHHHHHNEHRRGGHAHRYHHEPSLEAYRFNPSSIRFFKAAVAAFVTLILIRFLIWSIVVVSTPLSRGRAGSHWAAEFDQVKRSREGGSWFDPVISIPATQLPPVAESKSPSTRVLPSMRIIRHLPVDYPISLSSPVPSPSLD